MLDVCTLILSDDEVFLALNKPAGLLPIPDGYHRQTPNLRDLLAEKFDQVWTVHRLDKDTSGIVLFAKSAAAHRHLNLQFEQRQVQKEYHALVCGLPAWNETSLTQPLRVNGDRRHRTMVDPAGGKPAHTDVTLVQSFQALALVSARPHTGLTHQIRAHLAAAGHPVLKDDLYTRPAQTAACSPATALQRMALHAYQISFTHPASGQPLMLTAPYAPDFEAELAAQRANSTPDL